MRKIILSVIGILLIILASFAAKAIIDSNVQETPEVTEVRKNVFVETVRNRNVPIVVSANGTLTALQKVDLYAEVEGVFSSSSKQFRPGQSYRKGQVLLKIDAAEFSARVRSEKSELYNMIASVMPDLRIDYPDAYGKWQDYLNNFEVNETLDPLPEAETNQEEYFINGRGIVSAYYNIKNLEERLRKYVITAPFDGVLTEASVNRGSLVRPGQKLGEFIDPSIYELEVSVAKNFTEFLQEGQDVALSNLENTRKFTGTISRINSRVDRQSQTIRVFIRVEDENVREGMFLQANIFAREQKNAIAIPRELLVDRSSVYVVNDNVLELVEVDPVYYSNKSVVIKGLEDGTQLVSAPVPGAYSGLKVHVSESQENSSIQDTLKTD